MRLLRSLVISFSTYSRIPMPKVKWEERNISFAFCVFPLIGLIIGVVLYFWMLMCEHYVVGTVLRAAVMTIVPVIISGGIHMDGFCDTVDALSSHQSRERKLEILKDPNSGAFAIIFLCVYMLMYFAVCTELPCGMEIRVAVLLIPVFSRSLSGLAAVSFKNARKQGFLASFSQAAQTSVVRAVMLLWVCILCFMLLCFSGYWILLAVITASGLTFLYYRIMSYRQFGGITGDLAGFFLQLCELSCVTALMLTRYIST